MFRSSGRTHAQKAGGTAYAASHPMEHDVSHEASDPPRVVVERRELLEALERRVVGRSVGSARNGEQVLVSPSGEGVLE